MWGEFGSLEALDKEFDEGLDETEELEKAKRKKIEEEKRIEEKKKNKSLEFGSLEGLDRELDEMNLFKEDIGLEKELANLEKQLEQSGRRIAEYRNGGFYEQEAQEQNNYAEIVKKIDELKKQIDDVNKQIESLEAEAKKSRERINEYREGKFVEQEAQEQANYYEILEKISELQDKLNGVEHKKEEPKKEDSEKTDNTENKDSEIKWHPGLTKEQIEELIAENLYPGDEEYDEYLINHGLTPEKDEKTTENKDSEIKWHPGLTKEQIEELIAENLYPGDEEYDEYLINHGLDPRQGKEPAHEGPEDDGGKEPTEPGIMEPGVYRVPEPELPTQEPEAPTPSSNLPIRSFWEIYRDTCTEHVGSIAHGINKLANMKILPSKDEDIVQKVLSLPLSVFRIPMKLVAKIPNAIMGTDKKMEEMRANIDSLSEQEFQVLIQNPEKINAMFGSKVKDEFDVDYLDPQFMKQYKVNNAYLDAVRSRMGREYNTVIDFYRREAGKSDQKISELLAIGRDNWTKAQETQYNVEMETRQKLSDMGKSLQGELDKFDEGAKKKSSGFRNISGWFLAKFNPDNRDENKAMAEMAKVRRLSSGDITKVNEITGRMHEFARENTEIKGRGAERIDIGKFSIESAVEALDKGPQTKTQMLCADVALGTAIVSFAKQVTQSIANKANIEAHNQHLQEVNDANKEMTVSGNVKVSDAQGAKEAAGETSKIVNEATFNRAERKVADTTIGAGNPKGYKEADAITHANAAEATKQISDSLSKGNNFEALKKATNDYGKVQGETADVVNTYSQNNPQFDYSAAQLANTADASKIYNFLASGTVPYQTTINGTLANLMPMLKEGADPTALILTFANEMYQAGKTAKRKEFRKSLREEAENTTNQPENAQEDQTIGSEERANDSANAPVINAQRPRTIVRNPNQNVNIPNNPGINIEIDDDDREQ